MHSKVLWSSSLGPQNGTPNFGKPSFGLKCSHDGLEAFNPVGRDEELT